MTLPFSRQGRTSLSENLKNPTALFVVLSYFALCLFIRFPFFFRDYINHDESTFIIMGQSIVDGHLPYTQLWDLKPPIVFYFFAAIIQLFGKSLFAIRFSGVVVITLTSFFVSLIGKDIKTSRFGFYCGLGYIILSSLFGDMQGVMTEHLAMVFCVAGFYFFLRYREHLWGLFLSSALMGTSFMFRMNLVYPAVILFAAYLFTARLSLFHFFRNGLVILLGSAMVTFLSFLPYWINQIPHVWWDSVILAPLAYSSNYSVKYFSAIKSLFPCIIIMMVSIFYGKRMAFFSGKNSDLHYLRLFTVGLIVMLVSGGKVNGHYLIQLFPFLWIFVLEVFSPVNFKRVKKLKPILIVLLVLLPSEAYWEYYKLGRRVIEKNTFYAGDTFDTIEYIRAHQTEESSVLFLRGHIGYWLMDITPPCKIGTHPSNILRTYFYPYVDGARKNPEEELKILLSNQPEYIVNTKERLYFANPDSDVNQYYLRFMAQHYIQVKEFGRFKVYRRKDLVIHLDNEQ